jgi:flagellar hook-length control protein FliK
MNATVLPALSANLAQVPTEPAASPVAAPAEPADFVLALAQMLGTSAPATSAEQLTQETSAEDDDSDPEAALALLPLPMGQMPATAAAEVDAGDPLELLGLNTRPESAAARDAAILQALSERLASRGEEDVGASEPPTGIVGASEPAPLRSSASVAHDATAHTRPLQHPVGTQAWTDELGSRLTMMTEKGQYTASLRLSPEHLGPLEIRIAMREDQASVWFGAAHADTRAAIEHALPRLRELFEAQGMSLADAGVFREPPKQPSDWQQLAKSSSNSVAAPDEPVTAAARVQVGLIDAFA